MRTQCLQIILGAAIGIAASPPASAITVATLDISSNSSLLNDSDYMQQVLHNGSLVDLTGGIASIDLAPGDAVSLYIRGTSRSSPAGIGAASGAMNLTLINGSTGTGTPPGAGAKFKVAVRAFVNATGLDAFASVNLATECYLSLLCSRLSSPSAPEYHTASVKSDTLYGNTTNIDGNLQDTGRTGGDELLLDDVDSDVVIASSQNITPAWSASGNISSNSIASTALSELEITITVVPLPPAIPLMLLGLSILGAGSLATRRKRSKTGV